MLRQDAESCRDRREFAESRETESNIARSRWEGARQSGLGVPMPSSQERKIINKVPKKLRSGPGIPMPSSQERKQQ